MILTSPVLMQMIELLHRLHRIVLLVPIVSTVTVTVLQVRVPLTTPITPALAMLDPCLPVTVAVTIAHIVPRRVGWVEGRYVVAQSMGVVIVVMDLLHSSKDIIFVVLVVDVSAVAVLLMVMLTIASCCLTCRSSSTPGKH